MLEFLLKETKHAGGRSHDKRLNDFWTWRYVVVDDIWLKIAPFVERPGARPERPESECRGWDVETEMPSHWQEHRDLFPASVSWIVCRFPSRSFSSRLLHRPVATGKKAAPPLAQHRPNSRRSPGKNCTCGLR